MPENLQQTITIQPRGVEKTRSKISGLFAAFREGADEVSDAGDGVLGTLKSIGSSAKTWIAGTAVGAVAALTTAIGTATAKAIGFENALNEARKTADLSEREFRDLQEGLLDVQAELGTSQQELADIAAEAGRLGIESPDRIQEFTRTVALMSEATVASASETAQGLAKISNAFDLPIERAEALGSVINELSNQTVANASQIIDAMTRVGAAGQQVGLAADQVAGFAATLVDAGIDARRAGTGLRTIFTRMVNNSKKLAEQTSLTRQEILQAFEEDGLPAIRKYLEALRELPKAQRAAAIEDIFGVEQSLKVQTLVQNIDALNRQISDAQTEFGEADSLAAEFAATTKDVANEWNRLTAKLSAWVTDFGDNFTGMLESALSSLNDMLGTVDELARDLSDAQGRLSSVEGTQRLVEKLKEARQAGEDTSELIQKIAKEVPQRFLELDPATGDVIGVQTEALQKYLGTLRTAAEENLTERQTEALQQLNQAFQRLRRAQSRVDVFEPGTEGFKEARNQVQSANEDINTLLQTIKNRLPEGAEEARRALRKMLGDVNFRQLIGVSSLGAQEGQEFLFGRLSQLEPPEPEDDGGATTPGGGEGPSPEQRTKARKKLLEITRRITQEEQLRGAANEEARQALQNIFDLKARIRKIDELQNTLQGEQLKKAKEQKQVLQDRLEEQKNAVEEAQRPDAPAVPLVEPDNVVAAGEELGQIFEEEWPNFTEALLGKDFESVMSKFNDRISELRLKLQRGQISQQEFADRSAQAAEKYRQKLLDIVQTLEEMGILTPEMAKKAADSLEETSDQAEEAKESVENTGKALQDTARFVRGIGDLASQFGDLSDEAKAAIDSTATVLDNVGRLVELSNQAGGFSNIFSSFSGAVSGIGAILGAAGGLASLISTSYGADDKRQKKMEELRKKIDENVQALRENTQAILEQARVGENISRRTLERANELISQIASKEFGEMSGPKQERLLRRLENLAPMFEGVPDLLSTVEEYFVEEQPVSTAGENIVDDAYMRSLARDFVLTDATAQDVVDRLYENINVSTMQGIGVEELRERFGDDFLGIQERLSQIEEQFAQFSDTFSGVIEELNFRRQELGATFEQLRGVLTDRLPDLGFSDELIGQKAPKTFAEILESRMEDASRGGVEEIRQKLAESLAGDRDLSFLWQELEGVSVDELLGDVTPSQFEDFLDQLETITDVSPDESETDFSTSATVQRTITEHQANQLLAFQRELVQLGREQLDALKQTTILPFGPGSGDDGGDGAPVGIPAGLQETIAAAEANGFRPPTMGGQRNMKKIVNEGRAVYNIEFEINGEMSAERTARKVRQYLDEYLPRG